MPATIAKATRDPQNSCDGLDCSLLQSELAFRGSPAPSASVIIIIIAGKGCQTKMVNCKRCAHVAAPSLAKFELFLHHRGAMCSLEPGGGQFVVTLDAFSRAHPC